MIVTVALNAALDVTYHIDGATRPHATHRVSRIDAAAGGKALNTARVLHALGTPVLATGFLGGHTGDQIAERIPDGLRHAFVPVAGESRRALVVADPVDATGFWEPGPQISPAEWQRFIDRFSGLMSVATVVVLSGSLPQGLPVDAYGQLVALARQQRVATIVDCDGPALHEALKHKPDIIKPNAAELAEAVGDADLSTTAGVLAAADSLREAGAGAVVASRGGKGLAVSTPKLRYTAAPPEVLSGNPTGAGDACVAALARGLYYQTPWTIRLTEAVALSAAAVKTPVAGQVAVDDYLRYRRSITVKEL